MPRKGKSSKRNRPLGQAGHSMTELRHVDTLNIRREQAHRASLVDLNRRLREQADPATLTAYEHDIIAEGRKAPKTWDEINSNAAGGVDR